MTNISDSILLYVLVIIGILYVTAVALVFLRQSWKRAYELGFKNEELMNVVKSSISFSLVPSFAIVIGFFSIAAMLGVPWPWYRLSVIGSVGYEIMAADIALTATGADITSITNNDFTLIMFVMSICILGGLITSIFFAKKIQTGTMNIKKKDEKWGALGNSTFMLTIIIVLLIPMLLSGGVTLLTWLTSLGTALILGIIIKKYNVKWLSNFVLAISLLVAMVSSVLWTNLLG